MIVVDVNVLLAAFRQDHAQHELARPWLEQMLSGGDEVVVPDAVWIGFVRIATNQAIFEVPATAAEAFEFVTSVTGSAGYRVMPGLVDGLALFARVCLESQAVGNLIPDAYIASVARAYACPVASFDRDFRRFDDLEIVVPA
ncbi:TA system VapC family ribonuclease toxin [Agromyces italicus]|uniref:TA system VapC family ribonuclease toxin n=1 Tax=Agromyces italicus TaxID=279572 RepID=UPI0003B60F85|nr:TA system VapC family ribonuclease toxin [Agromyces italicus]